MQCDTRGKKMTRKETKKVQVRQTLMKLFISSGEAAGKISVRLLLTIAAVRDRSVSAHDVLLR